MMKVKDMTEELRVYYTAVLLAKAIANKGFGIYPVSGNKQFRAGLIVYGKDVVLYYNYEGDNTATVNTPLEN